MKRTGILIGVLSIVGCVALAAAAHEDDVSNFRHVLVGPYVSIQGHKSSSDYFLPSNVCIIKDLKTPMIDIINHCKNQHKGWLKI